VRKRIEREEERERVIIGVEIFKKKRVGEREREGEEGREGWEFERRERVRMRGIERGRDRGGEIDG